MSTTTASKRKRKVQRGKSTLVLSSHRSPAGLATFFLVSFQVVFWFASCFSGFFPGCFRVCQSFPCFLPDRFLVSYRRFSASILSGNCRHLLESWCVLKGSQTSFTAMASNQ